MKFGGSIQPNRRKYNLTGNILVAAVVQNEMMVMNSLANGIWNFKDGI